jgi:hypothetical protein
MTVRLFTILVVAALLAGALQAALPTWWWAGGLRLELLPAVVAYAALTSETARWAVGFALLAGFGHDALSAAPFGLTALGYGIAAGVLSNWREELERDLPWVQFGAGGFVSVCGVLVLLPRITVTWGTPVKVVLVACLSASVTPVIFGLLAPLTKEAR